MSINYKLSEFAGYPIREFSRWGFTNPATANQGFSDEKFATTANTAEDEFDRFAMDEPCAIRISPEQDTSGGGCGCCLGPIAGLVVGLIIVFATKVSSGYAVLAGVAVAIFIIWLADRREGRRMAREAQEAEPIPTLSDNPQRAVQQLRSHPAYFAKSLTALIDSGLASQIPALLIANNHQFTFEQFAKCFEVAAPHFQEVKALFINELSVDECEISWILNEECGSIASQFAKLEHLQIRGGGTRLAKLNSPQLKTLILESGGLGADVLDDIIEANLNNLSHLEVWIGQDNYGSDCVIGDIVKLLSQPYPQLERLGIRNCEFADEVIEWLVEQPFLSQIETLDLSLGCVTDKGAKALMHCDTMTSLRNLDLHSNYLSEEWASRLHTLKLNVDVSDRQEEERDGDEVYRYSAVGE